MRVGIGDRRPRDHQRLRAAPLDDALEGGELRAVVDAGHRRLVVDDVRDDGHAFGAPPSATTSVR